MSAVSEKLRRLATLDWKSWRAAEDGDAEAFKRAEKDYQDLREEIRAEDPDALYEWEKRCGERFAAQKEKTSCPA